MKRVIPTVSRRKGGPNHIKKPGPASDPVEKERVYISGGGYSCLKGFVNDKLTFISLKMIFRPQSKFKPLDKFIAKYYPTEVLQRVDVLTAKITRGGRIFGCGHKSNYIFQGIGPISHGIPTLCFVDDLSGV